MERRALVELHISLKMTKAWPLIFRLRDTRMSRICPNWEKMAYRDFLSSVEKKAHFKLLLYAAQLYLLQSKDKLVSVFLKQKLSLNFGTVIALP